MGIYLTLDYQALQGMDKVLWIFKYTWTYHIWKLIIHEDKDVLITRPEVYSSATVKLE